ncbi:MAG: hypothetical protein JSR18_04345 [Proteobacteria bacterium]|nr:hypothetical protein [Pseudomonadota bacterium]
MLARTPLVASVAVGDIFRLEQCKIVEHWDIIGSSAKDPRNPNSRF